MLHNCEEKIIELTSGHEFEKYIKALGLTKEDGIIIQNNLLNAYYINQIDVNNIESQLKANINKLLNDRDIEVKQKDLDDDEKYLIYRYNQEYMRVYCSNCRTQILFDDTYCHNCGKKTNYTQNTIGYNIIDNTNPPEHSSIKYSKTTLLHTTYKLLRYLQDNPVISNIPREILAPYSIDINAVIDYALNNNLIKTSVNSANYYLRLTHLSKEELMKIALNNKLKTEGTKSEIATRLIKNIEYSKLNLLINNKAYTLTDMGVKFLEDNTYIIFYDVFLCNYSFDEYIQLYNENKDKLDKIEIGFLFLKNLRKKYVKEFKWKSYRNTFKEEFKIAEFSKNKTLKITSLINLFICDINSWNNNVFLVEDTVLDDFLSELFLNLKKEYDLNKEVEKYFIDVYDSIELPYCIIPKQDTYNYLIELLNNKSIESIRYDIKSKFHFKLDENYFFDSLEEQKRVCSLLKDSFY